MNPFERPVTAGPNDRVVGQTEWGTPIYQTLTGQRYYDQPNWTPEPVAPFEALTTTVDDQGRGIHNRAPDNNPAAPVANVLGGLLSDAWRGIAAPGNALRGEPVSLGDTWASALDWGLLSAPMEAPAGALRAGGIRSADETPAQQIAGLLSEGRASEVTDDMMAAADDMELWRLYESGATGADMPMDTASRMARAEGMGFDNYTDLFHGTDRPIDGFDPKHAGRVTEAHSAKAGTWATNSPKTAESYADFSANSVPVRDAVNRAYAAEDLKKWDEYDALMRDAESLEAEIHANPERGQNLIPLRAQYASPTREYMGVYPSHIDAEGQTWGGVEGRMRGALTESKDYGMRGMDIDNLSDVADYGVYDPAFHSIRFDPASYRSRFARFDPRLSHLRNLSAGAAGVGLMNMLSQEEQDRLRNYLDNTQ